MAFSPDDIPPLLQSSLLGLLAERQQPIGTSRRRRLKRGLLTGPGPGATPNIPNRRPIAGARDAMGAPVLQRGAGPYPEDKTWWWQQDEPMEFSAPRLPDATGDPGIMMGMQGNPPGAVVRPMNEEAYLPPMEGGKPLPFDPSFDPSLANGMRDMPSPSVGQEIDPAAMMAGENAARQQAQQFQSPTPMLGMQGTPTPYSVPGVPRETAPAAMPAQPTSDDTWMAFLAAGLGILANNTGHYGNAAPAIGKGGMMGLQMFQQVRQNKQNEAYRQQQMQVQQQQLARQYEQMGINRQQVEAQVEAQRRANEVAQKKAELFDKVQNTVPGTKEHERALFNYEAFSGRDIFKVPADKDKKDIERPVADASGNPKFIDGQQVWRKFQWDKELEQWVPGNEFVRSGLKIQNIIQPEDKAKQVYAGESAKRVSVLQEESQKAREGATDFAMLRDLLEDYEGGAVDLMLAKIGQVIPADQLKGIASADTLANSVRLRASNAFRMPGAVSNYEQQTYLAAVPGMIWYKDGRAAAALLAEKLAERKAELVDYQQKLLLENGYVPEKKLSDYAKSLGPIFNQQDMEILKAYRNKKPPTASQKPSGPVLPSGGYKAPQGAQ